MSSSCVAFDTSKSDVGSGALVLPQYDSSWENIYGKKDSVHQRFPFDGKLLWEALRRHYFEKPSVQQFIATDYNDDQGKPLPLLERSPLNDRHEAALKETYMATMQESGGHWDGRSKPVIIKPHDPPHPLFKHVLAAAHCVEALYQCYYDELKKPEADRNPQIMSTIVAGVEGIELKDNTPEDVQRYVCEKQNAHQIGSSTSLTEVFQERGRLTPRYDEYKKSREVTVSKCGGTAGYEAVHRSWLATESKSAIFQNAWDFYDECGLFMKNCHHMPELTAFLSEQCSNLNRKGTLSDTVRLLYAADSILMTFFRIKCQPPATICGGGAA